MGLENLITYGVVFGLPLWLVAEEVLHRVSPHRKGAMEVSLRRGAPKRVPVHAHVVSS